MCNPKILSPIFDFVVEYSGFLIRHPVCTQTAVEINQLIYNVDRNKYIAKAACHSPRNGSMDSLNGSTCITPQRYEKCYASSLLKEID